MECETQSGAEDISVELETVGEAGLTSSWPDGSIKECVCLEARVGPPALYASSEMVRPIAVLLLYERVCPVEESCRKGVKSIQFEHLFYAGIRF